MSNMVALTFELYEENIALQKENEKLRAAIDRVLELHAPETRLFSVRDRACIVCRDEDGTPMEHPCPTIRAVDGDDA